MSNETKQPELAPSPKGANPVPEQEKIDEAALESFPASDPPAFTGSAASPSKRATPKIVVPPLPK